MKRYESFGDCMVGSFINSAAVVIGGVVGAVAGPYIPERLKKALPLICGLISISIGTVMINKVYALPPVALALLMGTRLGEGLCLEKRLEAIIGWIQHLSKTFQTGGHATPLSEEFMLKFVTVLVLFSVNGMGIFGAMHEGMTGDPKILLAKSVLDLS